jgi:hypothetical protein
MIFFGSGMSILGICQWLEQTQGSIALHESLWMYPIVESVHVLTLCVFLGTVVMLDLRLLGLTMRGVPVSEVVERLSLWTRGGFVLMVVSGVALFYAIPVRTYENVFFRAKVLMLVLAGLNAWVFHSTTFRTVAKWDLNPVPPKRARMSGVFSMILWAGIVAAGRMIAYNWFDKK